MAKNYDAIHIWGDEDTTVSIARKKDNPTIPTALEDLGDEFFDAGWLSEDGIGLEVSADVTKFKAYQGGKLVKTRVTSTENSFGLQFLQEDPDTTEIFYGHDGVTTTGGVAKYKIPGAITHKEYVVVIDFKDAGVTKRLVVETASPGERGTVPHQNSELTVLEVTFDIVGDAYVLTDDPVFVGAGTPEP